MALGDLAQRHIRRNLGRGPPCHVSNFGTYNATYGSLGAVIGFMVWMWLSIVIV